MKLQWQRWRRPLGGCLTAILIPVLGVAWIIKEIGSPYQSPGWISPQRQWRVWLERPDGSMEPMYYTIKARRESIFATPSCEVGFLSNWYAERYTQAVWKSSSHMMLEYGLSNRDTGKTGVPKIVPIPRECAGLAIETRRNYALDAAATAANGSNHNYAVPIPDEFPFEPTDTPSTSPLS